MRRTLIVGNWKMYKTIEESTAYMQAVIPLVKDSTAEPWLAVPFTAIHSDSEAAKGSNILVGAQNMNDASEGAFTGEISAKMLVNAGAQFVIVGHSERRHIFKEDDAFIGRKVHRGLTSGLKTILCIGEKHAERQEGRTKEVLLAQLSGALKQLQADQLENLVLAYEPVWAIGSHEPATPEQADEAHLFCREWLSETFGEAVSERTPILYGGSVKKDNAAALLNKLHIDGLLIGGASLDPASFSQIVNCQHTKVTTP